jgi:hypothetical protein
MSSRRGDRSLFLRLAHLGLLVALLSLLALSVPGPAHAGVPGRAPGLRSAAASYPAIAEQIVGPSVVGVSLKAEYNLTASGGPAVAPNGTTVGFIDFNITLTGTNVTTATMEPPSGVLINGSAILTFTAPSLAEAVTFHIRLTSEYNNTNDTQNFTHTIQVVPPYVLTGTIVAGPTTVSGFNLTVTLDGKPVGNVVVPPITANGSYAFTYDYVPAQGLAAGWHTIAVSLAPEHGLVAFQGGGQQLTLDFFITSPPPDYALDVAIGIAAFAVAVFIWGSVVGARRRGRRAR